MKKKIMIDMDGTLCNFKKAETNDLTKNPEQKFPQSRWGFFLELEEMPNAIESFNKLKEKYDMYILTKPSFRNVNSFTEKAQWVWEHLGFDILQNTIMCGDKSLVKGDYLIDDTDRDGQDRFEGEFIKIGSEKFPDWKSIVEYLL